MGSDATKLRIEYVPIGELRPDPFNPRRISELEMESLTRSIREFGLVDPLVVRREDNIIIGGHQRLIGAMKLGYTKVPVIFLDVSERQARLLNLALNRIGGEWDEELLGQLFKELKVADVDLALSGFGQVEISDYLKSLERKERRHRQETFNLEAALREARRVEPRTKRGDLYRLGEHILLCGDASCLEDVSGAMGGETADMAFCDPPYGVALKPRPGKGAMRSGVGKRFDGILGDDEPRELIEAAWENMITVSQEGCVIYICAGTPIVPLLHRLFKDTCGREPTILVWGKPTFTLSRRDYHPRYEFIFYGWLGRKHYWCGDRKQSDLWLEDREPLSAYTHPTQKPLRLVERAIKNSSREGDVVLDVFMGSGTTLIGCERLSRRCRGVELDPHYVDIAVRRWEAFTGERAVLEGVGD